MALFLGSTLVFEYGVSPAVREILTAGEFRSREAHVLGRIYAGLTSVLFYAGWLCPMYAFWLFIGGQWHTNLASAAYWEVGEKVTFKRAEPWHFMASETVYRVLVGFFVSQQALFFSFLPLFGPALNLVTTCLVFSYQCFESIWALQRVSLRRRQRRIENNWPYYAGFGAPAALVCFMSNSVIISIALYASLFPIFLTVASGTKPRTWQNEVLSPYMPRTIELFYYVRKASNSVVNFLLQDFKEDQSRPNVDAEDEDELVAYVVSLAERLGGTERWDKGNGNVEGRGGQ
eukprot:CAMPEP_0119135990 /NCGR_PEP_ID=MMETSP1310-20130426/20486_1 /TAXON_ID=464262 /ORGANISM="Genus nov. species nov., Strain RCC2339" /LENGTH=288 /DNA_ID=CAMNT_0007126943 /DNA_START=206 /DNA_END=1073 /DNA_ORIENTATION=+